MTNEAYTMVETIKERKSMLSGARHKKGGSKSKKCTLPSDTLSKKEKEKMNGEMRVYNLRYPVNYNTFSEFPNDIKEEYIRQMQTRYLADQDMLAASFGMNGVQFIHMLDGLGIELEEVHPDQSRRLTWSAMTSTFKTPEAFEIKHPVHITGFNLKPITLKQLKKMSVDDAIAYVIDVCHHFGVNVNTVAMKIFGLKSETITTWARFRNHPRYEELISISYSRPTAAQKARINDWLNEKSTKTKPVKIKKDNVPTQKALSEMLQSVPENVPEKKNVIISGRINIKLSGDIDQVKQEINRMLDLYYDAGLEIDFQVSK